MSQAADRQLLMTVGRGIVQPMMTSGFGFYRIHIIQSFREGEWDKGQELLKSLQSIPGAQGHLDFQKVNSKADLLSALQGIRDLLFSTGQIPLIHFESHGSEYGLGLGSGEFIYWRELKEVLTEINIACQLNLFIGVSACSGENLVGMARLNEPAPFWGCIGPRSTESKGRLFTSFADFYCKLLESGDLRVALDSAKAGLPRNGNRLNFWPAEFFLLQAFREYVSQECGDEVIRERAEWIYQRIGEGGQLPPPEVKEKVMADLVNHEHHFDMHRRAFLMLDLYPENEKRFSVSFLDLSLSPAQFRQNHLQHTLDGPQDIMIPEP